MINTRLKSPPSSRASQYLLALFFAAIGLLINLFPIELAFNISLVMGNTAYIIAASLLRPGLTFFCALICVVPLHFYWGHPFAFLTFGLEAWFISSLRSRGWYIITADLLYWVIIGMPLTAFLILVNENSSQSYLLFSTFKQIINAVLYTSLAAILLYTFGRYFQKINSAHPPLVKSLSEWLFSSFWSISAFFVITISLVLAGTLGALQRDHFDKELTINNGYINYTGNGYLHEHHRGIENIAEQLSHLTSQTEKQHALSKFHRLYPGFLTLLVTSDDGLIEIGSPVDFIKKLKGSERYVDDRPYFTEAMKGQETFVSSVFLGRGFGTDAIIAMSTPLYDSHNKSLPLGIVQGALDLSDFGLYGKQGHDKNNINIIVTDKENQVIYASPRLGFEVLSVLKYESEYLKNSPHLIKLWTGEDKGTVFLHKQSTLINGWKVYSLVEHNIILSSIEKMYLVIFMTLCVILFSVSFFAKKFASHISRPLAFVIDQLSKAKKTGDFSAIPYEAPIEIEILYQELKVSRQALLNNQAELQQQVFHQTEKLKQANNKLTEQANTDPLTGLYNRRYLEQNFTVMQSVLSRNDAGFMYIIIDLDFFKNINDTYGHLFGDYCLTEVANILNDFFYRDSDTLARFGGEEFVIIAQSDDVELLRSRIETLRLKISNHHFEYQLIGPVKITISVGIAVGKARCSTQQDFWLAIADKCLYLAKNNGRNQTVIKIVTV